MHRRRYRHAVALHQLLGEFLHDAVAFLRAQESRERKFGLARHATVDTLLRAFGFIP
jgi:hypothetical protein